MAAVHFLRLPRLSGALLLLVTISAFSQQVPVFTVRFSNPEYDFSTQTYSLDADFQSDIENQQLFGMNLRFWYNDDVLEFDSLGDFMGGYAPVNPNPPYIFTGNSNSGCGMFGFESGPAEYINGAVQLIYADHPIYISTNGWTKLFRIYFHVDDTTAGRTDQFCPSVIWDLEQDPLNGGFLTGSCGLVMTAVAPYPMQSCITNERVKQFNWDYDTIPGQPFGMPLEDNCISTRMAPGIAVNSAVTNSGSFVTLGIKAENFFDISAMTLTLDYDPMEMAYCCTAPDTGIARNFTATTLYPGRLRIHSPNVTGDYADGKEIMHVTFSYNGGSADISWFDEGDDCQFLNANTGEVLYDAPSENFYGNGFVVPGQYIWTGLTSGDWNVGANWQNGLVPEKFDNVVINSSPLPAHWPVINGNMVLGEFCGNVTLNGYAQLSVSGDLIINPGFNLTVTNSALVQVGGNWKNSGKFTPGLGTVEFVDPVPGSVSAGVSPVNYAAAYVLTNFPGGMTPVSGAAAGPFGDDSHADVSIGFNFKYLGTEYSQVRINTNGWMSFNLTGVDSTSGRNISLFNSSDPNTLVAPWWDDLMADGSASISYLVQGSSPNRVFTAEWKNILAYRTGSTARLNFQVKLYETSNIIEFCYGTVVPGTHNPFEGASIGIKDGPGGPGHFKETRHGTSHLTIACLTSTTNWPSVNYRFTPPVVSTKDVFYRMSLGPSAVLNISRDVMVTGAD